MRTIPLQPVRSQSISVELAGQRCTIRLIQRESFLYMDLTVNGEVVMQGVPCLFANRMVRYSYLGFTGDLVFMDNSGQSDPSYDGLGSRFPFYYMEASDLV